MQVASDILHSLKYANNAHSCQQGLSMFQKACEFGRGLSVLHELVGFSPRLEELVAVWDGQIKVRLMDLTRCTC